MSKDWQTLRKIKEYSNPFMEIWKHDVIRPNGNNRPYYVLERGIQKAKFSIAIPITQSGETFLVGQYRYPVKYYSWEFPMGHAIGKTFLDAAKIELREETGITSKKWIEIGRFYTAGGHSSEEACVFLAKDLTYQKSNPLDEEIIKVTEVSIKNIRKMIDDGKILDGPTIVAYHYLEAYL